MIHPVDAPLVFAPRRHPAVAESTPLDNGSTRRTVYSARKISDINSAGATSPQVRDDYNKPFSTWSEISRSMGRMPVSSEQHKITAEHMDSMDAAMVATLTAATGKTSKRADILHFPAPVLTPSLEAPLELKTAELNIGVNSKVHHTENYYATQRAKGPQLVLRRGGVFTITLIFYRAFDPANDSLKLIFEIGELPTIANSTKVIIPVKSGQEVGKGDHQSQSGWWASITGVQENQLVLNVHIPSNAAVGCWNFKVVSSLKHDQPSAAFLDSVSLIHGIYILFNPWSKDDLTYMDGEEEREEYVLNDSGKIWRGSHNSVRPSYWCFGQFEPGVLEAAVSVLDRSRLPYSQRASPTQVARLVAQVTNSSDGNGILVGSWSNDFSGGTPPTEWTSSVRILRQYFDSGRPVSYGQCWVFAGIVTTILRCLGIPSRVVTNYASARDSATGVTIDLHVNSSGKIDRAYTTDSIWAYHVWNECWFSRPDLPSGYGGWQAIDATPQEKSNGLYYVGPTSIRAVREGQVGLAHDTAYLFGEVNAEKCYWLMNEDGTERLVDVQALETGLCISTKAPGRKFTGMDSDDRLDVSEMYKYRNEGDGRRSVFDALLPGYGKREHVQVVTQRNDAGDVEMTWAMNKAVRLGDDFDVAVSLMNNSSEERTVKISLRIESMHYFGAEMRKIRSEAKAITLPPGARQEARMSVSLRDYLSKAMPQYTFMLTSLARVIQTGQIFLSTDDFRVKMPNVSVRPRDELYVGQTTTVILEFMNPLPVMLTKCKFNVDGPAVITSSCVPCRDVSPRGIAKAECQVTPWRAGRNLVLVAHFTSDQLQDIDGATAINVWIK